MNNIKFPEKYGGYSLYQPIYEGYFDITFFMSCSVMIYYYYSSLRVRMFINLNIEARLVKWHPLSPLVQKKLMAFSVKSSKEIYTLVYSFSATTQIHKT